MVTNIRAVMADATRTEHAAGQAWYGEAKRLAFAICPTDMHRGAGVIAALSPLTPWGRNKELAVRAFADGKASGTLSGNVDKANRILSGALPTDVLRGDKVYNFYLSIIGKSYGVCVDRHAMEVAYGVRFKDVDRPSLTHNQYEKVADAYRAVARDDVRYSASEIQAITWLVWRRQHLTGTRYAHLLEG